MLQSLLPCSGSAGSNGTAAAASTSSGLGKSSDVSKAAMLHRGAEYIRQLRLERQQQQEEMEQLKLNIEILNSDIRYTRLTSQAISQSRQTVLMTLVPMSLSSFVSIHLLKPLSPVLGLIR